MDSIGIDFNETEYLKVIRNLEALPSVMAGPILGPAWKAAGKIIRKRMREKLADHVSDADPPLRVSGEPRKHLRDAIKIYGRKWTVNGVRISNAAAVVIISRQPHWVFLEYGTIKQTADPFFKPSIIETQKEQFDAIRKAAVRTFNRYMKQMEQGKSPSAIIQAAKHDI